MRASDGSGCARVSMTPKPVRAVIAKLAMLTIFDAGGNESLVFESAKR